ncbi:uncharacterized protein CDV56_100170 [Aspergillus thermomutatus]|uniref:Uncharacterized protein n=1 Tax=Aspergillus thermomutatus TaxID=41047 RepID=A0A397G146_ASPTH|nr:uncharacterized protein CDV56_100170 [Aspergillus thermomutatus]RHZ43026.1 hypothetical protein CDV56_100170 [Aspergillus thermomutatus]
MTWLIPKTTSCVQLLEELEHLPPTVRQSIRSITLGQNLMGFDDGENHLEVALRLAAFLLDWKELETITIAMPDDLSAAGQDTGSYDYWSWVLHEPLLRAFARGRWREVRLAHPKTYTDPNLFLYHNIECYIEDWILPLEPRRQLNLRRSRYREDQYASWGGPQESRHQPQDSLEAVNKDCERTWAERGIVIQAENPGPGEMGTVLAVRWKAPWMREHRQAATAPAPLISPDLIPW